MNLVYDLKKVLIIKTKHDDQKENFRVEIDGIKPDTSTEDIYDLAQAIIKILPEGDKTINIYKEYINVVDKPDTPQPDPNTPKAFTEEFTLPKNTTTLVLTNKLTDEDVYGAALDGKNRKVKVYYLGTAESPVTPVEVPLEGFDTNTPADPNGTFSIDSSSNAIIFKTTTGIDVKYRLVKSE